MAKRRQYARDFSELTEEDRLSLAEAMARIGRETSEKARRDNLRDGRRALQDMGGE
jgi:hypothetical protein